MCFINSGKKVLMDRRYDRLPCRDLRESVASDVAPTSTNRHDLLCEFADLYKWSFQKSIYSALRVQGGMDSFDYQNTVMWYDLRYNVDCGGNPALSFSVLDAAFRPTEEIPANPAFVLRLSQSQLLSQQLALQGQEDFVGLVIAFCATENDFVFDIHEIYRHSPKIEPVIAKIHHDGWLLGLQRNIQSGFVFRPQDDQDGARLGRMKPDKSKWSWVPVSDKEPTSIGLPTMAAAGLPGEGFSLLF